MLKPNKSKVPLGQQRVLAEFTPKQLATAICVLLFLSVVMLGLGIAIDRYWNLGNNQLASRPLPTQTIPPQPLTAPDPAAVTASSPTETATASKPAPAAPSADLPKSNAPAEAPGATKPATPADGAVSKTAPAGGSKTPPPTQGTPKAPRTSEHQAPPPPSAPTPPAPPKAPAQATLPEATAPGSKTVPSPESDPDQAALANFPEIVDAAPVDPSGPPEPVLEPLGSKPEKASQDDPKKAGKTDPASEITASKGGKWIIQVAAFPGKNGKQMAEAAKKRLEKDGSVKLELMSGDNVVRVIAGGYPDKASAQKECETLRKKPGFAECFVKSR